MVPVIEQDELDFDEEIIQQGELISDRLNMLRLEQYPPDAQKGLRLFSLAEVADFIGVTQNHVKKLHLDGKGPAPAVSSSGRRSYTAEQMLELRQYLDKHGRSDAHVGEDEQQLGHVEGAEVPFPARGAHAVGVHEPEEEEAPREEDLSKDLLGRRVPSVSRSEGQRYGKLRTDAT